jgi:L-ascorbate metabolism protein UlaG (beta-lactamase superfamily)
MERLTMSSHVAVTRITHSCHLIEIAGQHILTDPWFSTTAIYYPGEALAMSPVDLPHLDAVLISHEHYDHCDLDAFIAYADHDVHLVVPHSVGQMALDHGFRNVTVLEPWESVELGDVKVTAAPGKHGVYEVTFIVQGGSETIYFAGDTMVIPELAELPERFGAIDLALLPTNGLCIRPLDDMQVVMNAQDAAELTATLKPRLVMPHHFAFTSGWLGDRLLTKKDKDPRNFEVSAKLLAPATAVRIVEPGTRVTL